MIKSFKDFINEADKDISDVVRELERRSKTLYQGFLRSIKVVTDGGIDASIDDRLKDDIDVLTQYYAYMFVIETLKYAKDVESGKKEILNSSYYKNIKSKEFKKYIGLLLKQI